jgi:hypothetical protein
MVNSRGPGALRPQSGLPKAIKTVPGGIDRSWPSSYAIFKIIVIIFFNSMAGTSPA